jgi:hypothetical protein
MSMLKKAGLLSSLALLGAIAASPAHAEYICYPYADGAPGGYNKITHQCNPLYIQWHGGLISQLPQIYKHGERHATLYGPVLYGNHPYAGHKY